MLHQSAAAGGQVVGHFWTPQTQLIQVDEVEVRFVAAFKQSAIEQPNRFCGFSGDRPYRPCERHALPARSIAHPMAKHVGGEAGVADDPAMRTAIAKANDRVAMAHHRQNVVIVIIQVVEDRPIQLLRAVLLQKQVIDQLLRPHAAATCFCRDTCVRGWLVFWIEINFEDALVAHRPLVLVLVDRRLGENARSPFRLAQSLDTIS